MVKLQKGYLKSKLPEALSSSSASDNEEEAPSYDQVDSDAEIAAQEETVEQRFGQRAINDEPKLLQRLAEIRANFYNRLSSQKLINNTKGRIPFSEHMTISKVTLFNSRSKRSRAGRARGLERSRRHQEGDRLLQHGSGER